MARALVDAQTQPVLALKQGIFDGIANNVIDDSSARMQPHSVPQNANLLPD